MSRLLRVSRWLFVFMLAIASPVAAQQPGVSPTLRGRVVDPQERGVPARIQVTNAEEQMTVAGDAGTVNVLSSIFGSVMSAREIESLPLKGRNFLELAFRLPGYPWTTGLFVLLVACVLALLAISRPLQASRSLAIVTVGWPGVRSVYVGAASRAAPPAA